MPNQNQNPGNFANNPSRAAEAGRKGGQASSGNFANNPSRAAEAGRKGGQASSGNFAHNPSRAAEAGRKGGQNSHGNRDKGTESTTKEAESRMAPHEQAFSAPRRERPDAY